MQSTTSSPSARCPGCSPPGAANWARAGLRVSRTASSTLVVSSISCSFSLRARIKAAVPGIQIEHIRTKAERISRDLTRTSLWRGLGPWRFAEGVHGDAFITYLEDLQLLRSARRVKDHPVAWSGLHQRARQWRHPADVVSVQIDLVEADDAHDPLRSSGVGVAHGRPEEDLRRRPPTSRGFRVHDFRGVDSFGEKANPSIDLAQPPFVVLIVRVFAAIAVARRPGHHLCYRRPLPGE